MENGRLPREAYERAERLLGHHRSELVLRASVRPRWIDAGPRFWYRVDAEAACRLVVIMFPRSR
jgi:dipeptidyl-peptidase-4